MRRRSGADGNEKRLDMRIRELIIKNFGKFRDKSILLEDGINILYGENESGKSTLHAFIRGMLFGMERGRGRASLNDNYSICLLYTSV